MITVCPSFCRVVGVESTLCTPTSVCQPWPHSSSASQCIWQVLKSMVWDTWAVLTLSRKVGIISSMRIIFAKQIINQTKHLHLHKIKKIFRFSSNYINTTYKLVYIVSKKIHQSSKNSIFYKNKVQFSSIFNYCLQL